MNISAINANSHSTQKTNKNQNVAFGATYTEDFKRVLKVIPKDQNFLDALKQISGRKRNDNLVVNAMTSTFGEGRSFILTIATKTGKLFQRFSANPTNKDTSLIEFKISALDLLQPDETDVEKVNESINTSIMLEEQYKTLIMDERNAKESARRAEKAARQARIENEKLVWESQVNSL